jgi:hypothetical protein
VDTQSIPTEYTEVLPEEAPHGCYEGFVYIGHITEDENGEPEEVIERVPCRRCRAAENAWARYLPATPENPEHPEQVEHPANRADSGVPGKPDVPGSENNPEH